MRLITDVGTRKSQIITLLLDLLNVLCRSFGPCQRDHHRPEPVIGPSTPAQRLQIPIPLDTSCKSRLNKKHLDAPPRYVITVNISQAYYIKVITVNIPQAYYIKGAPKLHLMQLPALIRTVMPVWNLHNVCLNSVSHIKCNLVFALY